MNELPKLTPGDGVPVKDARLHWIETTEANSRHTFTVWSPSIWQVRAHFNGKTKPCFTDHSLCEGGHDETNLRWYGFLFGLHHTRNGTAFMQLTPGAARSLMSMVAPGVSLRGMVVTVHRGPSKRGPLHIKVDRYQHHGEERMGQDMDPHASIFRLWKVKHLAHAMNLKLVDTEADIPEDPEDERCLKTPEPALSIMERGGVSSRKRGSRKTKPTRKGA